MVGSGLLYMFYRYPQKFEVVSLNVGGLEVIAVLHTIGAFLLLSFFVAHLYLITTGLTVTSNLKAMITGYEELPQKSNVKKPTQTSAEPLLSK
jgi:thiosulfate reductase cytochrome b subunit